MAERRTFVVSTDMAGLNLRSAPSLEAEIVKVLPNGEKVQTVAADVPDGWAAVKGGGYVMKQFLE